MEKKFEINQKSLLNILSSMQPICSKKTPLDATNNVLFQVGYKELVLKSTDMEISLQTSCSLDQSSIEENYAFLVHGRRIFEVVKELEGPINFSINKNQLKLKTDKVDLALNIKDPEDFPPFPEKIENIMHLNASNFLGMIDSVAFLIPQNNANPALNGLLLEISKSELKMTTTDGHCLAQAYSTESTFEEPKSWLLPRRAVYELKKILETSKDETIFIGMCGNQLVFSGELFNFFTKLLADEFPHYQSILDKTSFQPASIDRSSFLKTLRRSTCLLSGQFISTKFNFDKSLLSISIQNKEVGSLNEQLPLVNNDLSGLDINFYSPYILSGIQALDDDKVTFYLRNSTSPIIFESNKENHKITYLVMPISPTSISR